MRYLVSLSILLSFLLFSCEEIPPVITPITGPDTTEVNLENQQRQVLIEEFTGVRCVQCPAGAAEIKALLAIHGERLVAVSIHAGGFAPPFTGESQYDFRTPEGDQILSQLMEPFGYPSAVVNRKKFDGEIDLQLSKSQWPGYIEQEKAIPPKVKIGLIPDFNLDSRLLDLEVLLVVQEAIDEEVFLSVMITESGIIDVQDTPDGKKTDYEHNHVLRDMLTSANGELVAATLSAGQEITKNYTFSVPAGWNPDNCHVVAFVHLGADKKEVLQAIEVDMTEE